MYVCAQFLSFCGRIRGRSFRFLAAISRLVFQWVLGRMGNVDGIFMRYLFAEWSRAIVKRAIELLGRSKGSNVCLICMVVEELVGNVGVMSKYILINKDLGLNL